MESRRCAVRETTYRWADIIPAPFGVLEKEDLLDAVLTETANRIVEYCRRPWSDKGFLNTGVGLVVPRRQLEKPGSEDESDD